MNSRRPVNSDVRVHSLITKITVIAACSIAIARIATSAPTAPSTAITADRAWHLAARYYSRHVSGCGGVGPVVLRGDYWDALVHFGYAGTLRGSIRVDRRTGSVSYGGYPTVSAQSLDSWFASATKRHHAP